MPRDLETIVLKALAKEPAARYRSADEMAEDLKRFIADRPILSRRANSAERLVRWCRRNPIVASLTGAVAALLVAAVVILAVSNARIQRQSEQKLAALDQKNAALMTAGDAVQRMLVRIADDKLSGMPRTQPLRRALLQDAQAFYDGLLRQSGDDIDHARHTAELHFRVGKIYQELEQYPEALQAYRRSAALLGPLVEAAPRDIRALQALAEAREAAAIVQFIAPTLADGANLESQFHSAILLYDQVQVLQPDRKQRPPACLGLLADLQTRRGATNEALQTGRESIARGELFLEQFPEHTGAHVALCWSCLGAADRIMKSITGRYTEAESLHNEAIQHANFAMQRGERDFAGIAVGRIPLRLLIINWENSMARWGALKTPPMHCEQRVGNCRFCAEWRLELRSLGLPRVRTRRTCKGTQRNRQKR